MCKMPPAALLLLLLPSMAAPQSCQPSLIGGQDGDIILGGLFSIHSGGLGVDECGRAISEEAIHRLEAFFYVMDSINSQNTIPGVMLGSVVHDSCGRPQVAVDKTLEFLGQAEKEGNNDLCPNAPKYIGLLGPLTSSEAEAVGILLTSAKMLHLSISATSQALGNRQKYPYFRRVVPDSTYSNMVLLDILQNLTWSRITVVTSTDADAQDRKQELLRTSGVRGFCVDRVIEVSRTASNLDDVISQLLDSQESGVDGVVFLTSQEVTYSLFSALSELRPSQPGLSQLSVVMGTQFLDEDKYASLIDVTKGVVSFAEYSEFGNDFRAYFTDLDPEKNTRNPWFKRYWEEKHNCTLGVTCQQSTKTDDVTGYKQAMYVTQTAVAVYALAYALKDAHADLCGGATGLCAEMRRLTADRLVHYIEQTSFTLSGQDVAFDQDGEYADRRYQIFNTQLDGASYKQQQVGVWSPTDGIKMNSGFKVYNSSKSSFPPDRPSPPRSGIQLDYTCENSAHDDTVGWMAEGDVLLEGVFDIHEQGVGGAECGGLLGAGLQAAEAMMYAIDLINSDPHILDGVRLGAALTDSCRSVTRAVRQTLALVQGKLRGTPTDMDNLPVTAIVGGASSDISMAIAEKVTPYQITQMSYSSTATELSDTGKFPYFMRTVGSDKAQIKALIDIIVTFNWTYVKVIFSNNEYGNAAIKQFLHLAARNSICVATQIKLEYYFSTDMVAMRNIVRYYFREAFLDARVVVMFTTDSDTRALLGALQSLLGEEVNDLIWLATDYWGSKQSVTEGVEGVAKGGLTLDFQSNFISGFMNKFRSLTPGGHKKRNPWFDEYWQAYFSCHTSSSYVDAYEQTCTSRETLKNAPIKMATEVPYVIDAVYSIALGLDALLVHHCGHTSGLCSAARDNMGQLSHYISTQRFYNSITNRNVSYDVLGDGVPRFKVLNYVWQNDTNSFIYRQIGTWEDNILDVKSEEVYSYAGENGSVVKYADVSSTCRSARCMCTSAAVTDLKFQLKYARLTLLGYFPVNQRSAEGVACSQIRPEEGFLPLMAFKYAVDRVNADPTLLGNLSLGYMLFDTCSEPEHATLVFDAFDKTLRFFTQPPQVPVITYVHAFIGGHEDHVSKALNKANFNGQRLVQVSAGSADDALSNKETYPYFLRTHAPASNLVRALVGLVQALGWSYVSAVLPATPAGRTLADKLSHALTDNGACLAAREEVDPSNSDPGQYETAIRALSAVKGAVGLIVLTSNMDTRQLLMAAQTLRLQGRFVWVGTDQWGSDLELVQDLTDVARGAFSLSADVGVEEYFRDYMRRVTHDGDPDNPWLREFWETHFRCNLQYKTGSERVCAGTETLNVSSNLYVINTINAVYAYARGLTRLFKERCGGMVAPPCAALRGGEQTTRLVQRYIHQEQFQGAGGRPFSFTQHGDGTARYNILNYALLRQENDSSLLPAYIQVGEWTGKELFFNRSLIHTYDRAGARVLPRSECPSLAACNCTIPQGPLDTIHVPLTFTAHRSVWGILVITFSLLGIVFAVITMMFFIFEWRHPVVLGATCSLSVLLLTAILLLYLLNFAFMLSDTLATCGLRRFGLGVLHTLVFACLLVKIIRIRRIWNKANLAIKPAFISGPSQTAAAMLILVLQVVLASEWIIITPPSVRWTLIDVNKGIGFPIYVVSWICEHSKESLVTSLIFVFLLVIVTLSLAVGTRHATHFQHEALCILITSVLSAGILVTWQCVYLLAGPQFETPAVCVGITLTATTVFVVMFVPKMLVLTASHPSSGVDINNVDYDGQYAVPKKRNREPTNNTGMDIITSRPRSFHEMHEISTAL